MLSPLHIYSLNESAVTIKFGDIISEDILAVVTAYDQYLNAKPFQGMTATVPAYASLSVFYDPLKVIESDLVGVDAFERVQQYLSAIKIDNNTASGSKSDIITIPVCYGGDLGPDLNDVAMLHDLSTYEVIKLHTQAICTVYMIGFVPGFAYMGGMNKRLASPRKSTPRKAVPAGAVGIAGEQTGIYPLQTPGGWQLIGQTPLKMFDASRKQPSLLKAGDRVQFKSVSIEEFNQLKGGN
ncbi:5-oxoprolinase subunit PxpB [Mucilaginibacter myungsuensis]|uniref:5-oxoprolinase subunit PxpB n=1 Tax=Mucilaginibacter myungsuensis TaxID=649104 RepID=A0A929KUQ8_9SPHI|nr:5-oxoprolinase subunit PxpB [Mucilaginibacter myungsuensis]MBE9660805.1 5-oxoprolinase subunit PxpB [Mucilaginibacter myungsuensis]MDN3600851.1 5-oxoprolinase subunit PxpB [Mucilaginibacter myungsuensis]